ncbi:MAG: amidase [Cyanothece sp. SIO1E1]|nr:amidase [Cyanothece sp. SIO1E1]
MHQLDLAFTPALKQAELIRRKEISPVELVELYLNRIQRLNSTLGSYFTVAAEQALVDANAKADVLVKHSEPDGLAPFFGVPIAIKDLNPVAGMRCTWGSQALSNQIAPHDDAVVTRIKQAGFIILGKTATSEFGSLPYTEPDGFPPARNPWNLDYTPGGSSGGSAAAVAAGLCAIAQGSDGGGSIRGPAFCCGLVGIKPSRGRVSHAPVGDYQSGISTNGPLARTVTDAAALLDVMSGYVTGDPYWLPPPANTFLATARQGLRIGAQHQLLRIAYSTSLPPFEDTDPVCETAVLDTVKLLESMGHQVEAGCPEFGDLIKPFTVVWQAGVTFSGVPGEAMGRFNRWLFEQAISCGDYLRAVAAMQIIARRIVAFFDRFDVLVLPTYRHRAIRVGEWNPLGPEATLQKVIDWVAPCPPFNASGQPAIALPKSFDANGVPVGIQIIGRPAAEETLIALAAQLEAAGAWQLAQPAIAAE